MSRMPVTSNRQRVAAYGVARRDDEVLLARASSDTGVPATWWLPGGGVEFGESPEECLVREFLEETGLEVRVRDVLDVVSDVAELTREPVRLHSVRLIYEVEVLSGSVRPETSGSTDAVRWVGSGDLEALPLISWLKEVAGRHLSQS
jgi:8-oxo-dGTP diphosphatase